MQPDIKNISHHLGQYQTAADTSEQPITVTDEIVDLFNTLFVNATKHQPENWTRAIFTINRQGQFNLNFERENTVHDIIVTS